MKLTLATCALGALGLTPVLHGSLGDPVAPTPPVPAVAPVALPGLGQALASTPLAPAAPAEPHVALLRQDDRRGVQKDAALLKSEIDRLRAELNAMQKELNKTKRSAKKSAKKGKEKEKAGEGERSRRIIRFTDDESKAKQVEVGRIIERDRAKEDEARAALDRQRLRFDSRSDDQRARNEERREREEEMRERAEDRRSEARERNQEARERAMERGQEARERAMERVHELHERAMEHAEEAREHAAEAGAEVRKIMVGRSRDGGPMTWSTEEGPANRWVTVEGSVSGGDAIDMPLLEWVGEDGHGDEKAKKRVFALRRDVKAPSDSGRKSDAPTRQRVRVATAPTASNPFQQSGRIDAGGPNTFNIHVQDGDVHIHTHGGSNISTSKGPLPPKAGPLPPKAVKGQKSKAKSGLFGAWSPEAPKSGEHQVRMFARIDAEDGEEPEFELNFNGKDIDLSGLLADIRSENGEFPVAIAVKALGEIGDLGGIMEIEGLENLKGLEALEALEGLDGLFEMDIDVDIDLDDITELKKGMGLFSFVVDDDEDGDDEECEEEEHEQHGEYGDHEDHEQHGEHEHEDHDDDDAKKERDNRFVRGFYAPRPTDPAHLFPTAPQAYFLASDRAQVSAAPFSPSADEELLALARQIQADVQALRAELDELRAEVLGAPRRR